MYLRVTPLSGSSPQHAFYYKPCDVTFTADLCENLNRRVVGKFRVSRHFVESYAQGDASFRTISVVQSIQQHSAPNSKSRFRSRILLLSQSQGKSTSKLGLCCDRNGISATTTQKISTRESSGKRKFTPGQIATAYMFAVRGHKVHAKVLNSTR